MKNKTLFLYFQGLTEFSAVVKLKKKTAVKFALVVSALRVLHDVLIEARRGIMRSHTVLDADGHIKNDDDKNVIWRTSLSAFDDEWREVLEEECEDFPKSLPKLTLDNLPDEVLPAYLEALMAFGLLEQEKED